MLVNFTVKNFRSFKKDVVFSMEASSVREHANAVKTIGKHKLLPLTVLYGANSSGKSNLIKAIAMMKKIVVESVRLNDFDVLPYEPFALDNTSGLKPTMFEIQFIKGDATYRYGFEYNSKDIVSEWFYERRFGEKEYELFLRSRENIYVSKKRFPEGAGKENLTNNNRLFLSVVAQLKGEKSNSAMAWFYNCNVLSGIDSEYYASYSQRMFQEHLDGADDAQDFFNDIQLGFNKYFVRRTNSYDRSLDNVTEPVRSILDDNRIEGDVEESITTHNIYSENGFVIGEKKFHKDRMESEGTKKIIEMSGPIFNTLLEGKTLIVDELDAKLHPLLTRNIVLLFMNPKKNNSGGQLVFATHDTNLLDLDVIRRDQIWFAEKDNVESTDIYSLVEFKDEDGNKVRNDRDIKRDYIRGRYGAIPFIGK